MAKRNTAKYACKVFKPSMSDGYSNPPWRKHLSPRVVPDGIVVWRYLPQPVLLGGGWGVGSEPRLWGRLSKMSMKGLWENSKICLFSDASPWKRENAFGCTQPAQHLLIYGNNDTLNSFVSSAWALGFFIAVVFQQSLSTPFSPGVFWTSGRNSQVLCPLEKKTVLQVFLSLEKAVWAAKFISLSPDYKSVILTSCWLK